MEFGLVTSISCPCDNLDMETWLCAGMSSCHEPEHMNRHFYNKLITLLGKVTERFIATQELPLVSFMATTRLGLPGLCLGEHFFVKLPRGNTHTRQHSIDSRRNCLLLMRGMPCDRLVTSACQNQFILESIPSCSLERNSLRSREEANENNTFQATIQWVWLLGFSFS